MRAPANVDSTSPITAAHPCAGLPNGLHHLAICHRRHEGADRVLHRRARAGARGALLDARGRRHVARLPPPQRRLRRLRPERRRSRTSSRSSACPTRASPPGRRHPGAVQHVALNVDSEDDLLAMRDRIRSRGHRHGPASTTACASRSTSRGPRGSARVLHVVRPIDAARWIDPEVAAFCGIDTADLRYRAPEAFASQGGAICSRNRARSRPSCSPTNARDG